MFSPGSGFGGIQLTAAAAVLGALLLGSCGVPYVATQVSARVEATSYGIRAEDRDALDQGNLGFIRDRYAGADWNVLSLSQLSLLCDVLVKYGEYNRAGACLNRFEQRLQSGQDDVDRKSATAGIAGKRALLALAVGNPEKARALVAGAANQGARYVLGLADIQLARQAEKYGQSATSPYNAEAEAIADLLARQFDPAPVYYAASLYAGSGNCQKALDLLNEPERSLLRDYGVTASRNAFGSTIHTKPFRLDVFGEFSFGWFNQTAFAPAANVYVEYLAARCLRELHQDAEARARLDALLSYPNIEAYRDVYWRALSDRAQLAAAERDDATSINLLQRSIEVIEAVRSSISTEQGRIAFVDDKLAVYSRLVELLIQTNKIKVALEYVERSHSRALVDLLSSRQQIGSTKEDEALVNENERVEADLNVASTLGPEGTNARAAAVNRQHLLIRQRAPQLAPLITVPPVSVEAIQTKLHQDEAAIVFFKAGQRWWVFVLKSDTASVYRIATTNVEADADAFRSVLSKPRASGSFAEAQRLYRDLLAEPLRGLAAKRLVIVATGPLHHVPMAALHDGKQYLVERFAINMVPALSSFTLDYRENTGAGGLVIGDPGKGSAYSLPKAEDEARFVASNAPGSKLLIGQEATIDAIRSNAAGHRFFHFAGHGSYNQTYPLESALMLAPASGHLQPFTTGDLFRTRLDVDLAVLSGCSTGLGQITTGDDVIGLVRGFLYAGPKAVVGSLWVVDDSSTATFMKTFYRSYLSGRQPPDALRDAQLDLIKKQFAPFFWASLFVTSVQE